ncbi:unnamed protein product [Adineta ricciae]|uniref:Uncharacterized protein n=1 Tax=Adineta ricciae TaxID=249248 RepID=A0A814RUQ9_ADIRI|nr:unnamed protein product [Adineta ricciae]
MTDALETTSAVSIVFDGLTLETWNDDSLWNKTRSSIVQHLNKFCKHDTHCDAEYGIDNIHLLDANQHQLSSIRLLITVDKPVLNQTNENSSYNYTELLTGFSIFYFELFIRLLDFPGALYQAKIDIERLHDNQLLKRIIYSTTRSHQNSILNRTSRLFSVLLGIIIVAIVFTLTIFFFQKIRQHHYSKIFQGTHTRQQAQDDDCQSTSVLHS